MYQSPLHILKGLAGKGFEITQPNLIRLRKQLLADLNLSEQPTITVNKKLFSKDDIIKTFDILLEDPEIDFHEFIYKNKELLAFLEREDAFYTLNSYLRVEAPAKYQQKLDSLMEERFMLQFKRSMGKRSFFYAIDTILFINRLPEEKRYARYETVYKSLASLIYFLDELLISVQKKETNESINTNLKFLADESFADFLNSLPVDFNETINQLLNRIINIMFYYQKLSICDKPFLAEMSHVIVKVRKCDESQYWIIRRNHKVYSKANGGDGSVNPARIIYWILAFLFMFFKMCH